MAQPRWQLNSTLVTMLALALVGAVAVEKDPVGTYRVDLSHAPKRYRDMLRLIFPGYVAFYPQGSSYHFSPYEEDAPGQTGYWRWERNRLVLVHDGILSFKGVEPRSALMKLWPTSHVDGYVLRRSSGGSFVLSSFGAVEGPIYFRPMPRRIVAQLLDTSSLETDTPAGDEAYHALKIDIDTRWPDVLRYIGDHQRSLDRRGWASILLYGLRSPQGINAIADWILQNPDSDSRRILRPLAGVVARHPTTDAVEKLVEAEDRKLVPASVVAEAIGRLGHERHLPLLVEWTMREEQYVIANSLSAIAVIRGEAGLDRARALTNHAESLVQAAAYGLILRASSEGTERALALRELYRIGRESGFFQAARAVDALIDSGRPEVVPILVALLETHPSYVVQRDSATGLGKLLDRRAVPSLMRVKQSSDYDVEVRRAAAEALVLFDQAQPVGK